MHIEYEKSCTSEYIILDVLGDYEGVFMEKMLLKADIPGLLHVDKRFFNGIEKYYYRIDSYISLADYYKDRTMGIDEILNILFSVSEIFNSLSDYLLDGRNIVLLPNFIYKKLDEDKILFCFYPGFEAEMSASIMDFALFLMEHADSEDSNGSGLVYEYYELVSKGQYDPLILIKKYQKSIDLEGQELLVEEKVEESTDEETFYFAEPIQEEEVDDNREILVPLLICAIIILTSSVVYVYVFMHPKLLALIGIAQESYVVIGAAMAFVLSILLFFIVKLYFKKAERMELKTVAIEETEYKRRMRQGNMERVEYEMRTAK